MPPRPKTFDTRNPGHCKFCGDRIEFRNKKLNKRASWHPHCALTWAIMNNPQQARRFVFVRDRGVCRDCGTDCFTLGETKRYDTVKLILEGSMSGVVIAATALPLGTWELDHIIPLWMAPHLGNPPHLWKLGNMATLCPACHVTKTKSDEVKYASTREAA